VTLAALCGAVVTMTLQSAYRWRSERQRLDRDEALLDGALAHQQRVEADLRVSETQLRAVLASTPDAVAVLDPVSRRLQLLNRIELIGHPAKHFEQDGFVLTIAGDDDAEFRLWIAASSSGPTLPRVNGDVCNYASHHCAARA
jgi:PAS domain-containing protein